MCRSRLGLSGDEAKCKRDQCRFCQYQSIYYSMHQNKFKKLHVLPSKGSSWYRRRESQMMHALKSRVFEVHHEESWALLHRQEAKTTEKDHNLHSTPSEVMTSKFKSGESASTTTRHQICRHSFICNILSMIVMKTCMHALYHRSTKPSLFSSRDIIGWEELKSIFVFVSNRIIMLSKNINSKLVPDITKWNNNVGLLNVWVNTQNSFDLESL